MFKKDEYVSEEYKTFEYALKMYFHLIDKEQKLLQEAMIFDEKAKNESSISALKYDGVAGSGCSVTVATCPISFNVKKMIECEHQARRCKALYQALDTYYQFEAKIGVLESENKSLLYQVYKYGYSFATVAQLSSSNISKQAVANKARKIIKSMLRDI